MSVMATAGGRAAPGSRRRSALVLGLTAGPALLAWGAAVDPQADVSRLAPHLLAAVVLVAIGATLAGGPRVGVVAGSTALALAAAATLVLVAAIEPIPWAECGTLLEELDDPSCRSEGPVGVAAAAAATAVVASATALAVGFGGRVGLRSGPPSARSPASRDGGST